MKKLVLDDLAAPLVRSGAPHEIRFGVEACSGADGFPCGVTGL
ncbi:hypothetical protein [Streptomyces sp. cmx-4-7]